jgi:hypothetical protein
MNQDRINKTVYFEGGENKEVCFEASSLAEINAKLKEFNCDIDEEVFELIEEHYKEALAYGEAEYFDFSCPEDRFKIYLT